MELETSREGPGGKVLGQRHSVWFSGVFKGRLEAGDIVPVLQPDPGSE